MVQVASIALHLLMSDMSFLLLPITAYSSCVLTVDRSGHLLRSSTFAQIESSYFLPGISDLT